MYWGQSGSVMQNAVKVREYGSVRRVPISTASRCGCCTFRSANACLMFPWTLRTLRLYLRRVRVFIGKEKEVSLGNPILSVWMKQEQQPYKVDQK